MRCFYASLSALLAGIALAPASAGVVTDQGYQTIRDSAIADIFVVKDVVLHRDAGTLTLKSGTIGFTMPVMAHDTVAVFQGEGEFTLTPDQPIEQNYLKSLTDSVSVKEVFDRAMFAFTDETGKEIRSHLTEHATDSKLADILHDYRKHLRDLDIENIDAELLTDLYHSGGPGFFSVYLHGRKHGDLRFHVKPRGAVPSLGPEEVMLINVQPRNVPDETWYLAHLRSEVQRGKGKPEEDHRVVQAVSYKIDTVIAKNDHFTASAVVKYRALSAGDRVIRISLVPTLRVSKVTNDGQEAGFIQEKKEEDSGFYVVLPKPLDSGGEHELAVEYQGDKVVHKAGGGNFSVGARQSWYPNLNPFRDYATYDLTFQVPKQYTLVSVGKLVKQGVEQGMAYTHWTSDIPLPVAGFNFGTFKKKTVKDEPTGVTIEGYANSEVPDYLKSVGNDDPGVVSMAPSRLIDQSLADAQNAIRIYSAWFGKPKFDRLALTQQPDFGFGQSWPSLVYLPMSAYLDSTQRWRLLGEVNGSLNQFVEEVTPHEVAHQWWGHMVGDATYHDTWLSEGFADFSAALYLQITQKTPDNFIRFWGRTRDRILDKNSYGRAPNDAGPLSLGYRLITEKNPGAYNTIVYGKGAYVLHMLRQMMSTRSDGDRAFIEMMKEFVEQNLNHTVTTETFQQVAEKHMRPEMNLRGDGKLDWFFSEWVYGTAIPKYKLDYTITPDPSGKFEFKGTLTQSGVPDDFAMLVPIYVDFDGAIARLGSVPMRGNHTAPIRVMLPKKPKRVLANAFHDVLEQ